MWKGITEGPEGGGPTETPSSSITGGNQEFLDLQDQNEQQQTLIAQLKEMLRKSETINATQEKVAEYANTLSTINARVKRSNKLTGNVARSIETPASGKIQLLRQQLEENKVKLAERGKNQKGIEDIVTQIKAQLDLDSSNQHPIQISLIEDRVDYTPNTNAQDLYNILLNKDKKINELTQKITKIEANNLDLQENCKEKDQVIDARTKAITLMSENLSKKGKSTLDTLDETKEQMRKMQNDFIINEEQMKLKHASLLQQLEESYAQNEGKSKGDKTNENTIIELMANGDKLKKQLDEANKAMIKVKAQHKGKLKEANRKIDAFKKIGDVNVEVVRLEALNSQLSQQVAELEEEKGNLQLSSLAMDSKDSIQIDEDIKELESKMVKKDEQIAHLEKHNEENQRKIGQLSEKLENLSILNDNHVSSDLNSVQIEEQLENSHKIALEELSGQLEALKREKLEMSVKMDAYLAENMELMEKLSAEKVSSAESIEIVEKLEFEENVDLNESVHQLTEETSELLQKIELFTIERREVMEKMEFLRVENAKLLAKNQEIENNRDVLVETYEEIQTEKEELRKALEEAKINGDSDEFKKLVEIQKQELREMQLKLLSQEKDVALNEALYEENANLARKIEENLEEIGVYAKILEDNKNELIESSTKLQEKSLEISNYQSEVNHLNSNIEDLGKAIAILEEENEGMMHKSEEIVILSAQLDEFKEQIQDYENEMDSNAKIIKDLNLQLKKLQSIELNLQRKTEENERLERICKEKDVEFHRIFEELKEKCAKLQDKIENNSIEATRLQQLEDKNKELVIKMKKIAANLKKKNADCIDLEGKHVEVVEKWEFEVKEKEQLAQINAEITNKMLELTQELEKNQLLSLENKQKLELEQICKDLERRNAENVEKWELDVKEKENLAQINAEIETKILELTQELEKNQLSSVEDQQKLELEEICKDLERKNAEIVEKWEFEVKEKEQLIKINAEINEELMDKEGNLLELAQLKQEVIYLNGTNQQLIANVSERQRQFVEDFQNIKHEHETQLQDLTQDLAEKVEKLENATISANALQMKIQELESVIEAHEADLVHFKERAEKLEQELFDAEAQKAILGQNCEELGAKLDEKQLMCEEFEKTGDYVQQSLQHFEKHAQLLEQQLADAKLEVDALNAHNLEVTQTNARYLEQINAHGLQTQEIDALINKNNQLEAHNSDLNKTITQLHQDMTKTQEAYEDLVRDAEKNDCEMHEEMQRKLAQKVCEFDEVNGKFMRIEEEYRQSLMQIEALKDNLGEAQSQCNFAKNMMKQIEELNLDVLAKNDQQDQQIKLLLKEKTILEATNLDLTEEFTTLTKEKNQFTLKLEKYLQIEEEYNQNVINLNQLEAINLGLREEVANLVADKDELAQRYAEINDKCVQIEKEKSNLDVFAMNVEKPAIMEEDFNNLEDLLQKIKTLEFMLYSVEKEKDNALLQCHELSNELTSLVYEREQIKRQETQIVTNFPTEVIEEICVAKTAYLCQPGVENDDGWGWGPNDAKLEQEHLEKRQIGGELEARIQVLELERANHLEEIKQSQIKAGKLIKKLKEFKAKNDALKKVDDFGGLDDAILDELKQSIVVLEKRIKELNGDLEKERLEKTSLLKRIEVLVAANERFVEMKEKQDMEMIGLQHSQRELLGKLQKLEEWDGNCKESPTISNDEATITKIQELNEIIKDLSLDNEELQILLEEQRNLRLIAEKSKQTTEPTEDLESKDKLKQQLQQNYAEKTQMEATILDNAITIERLNQQIMELDEELQATNNQEELKQAIIDLNAEKASNSELTGKIICLEQVIEALTKQLELLRIALDAKDVEFSGKMQETVEEWAQGVEQRGNDVAESWKLHLESRETEFMQIEAMLRKEIYDLQQVKPENEEMLRLNEEIAQKTMELEGNLREIQTKDEKIAQLNEDYNRVNNESSLNVNELLTINEQCEREIQLKNQEIAKLRENLNDFEGNTTNVLEIEEGIEFRNIKKLLQEKDEEVEMLIEIKQEESTKNEQLLHEIALKNEEISKLREKFAFKNEEISKLREEFALNNKEIAKLREEFALKNEEITKLREEFATNSLNNEEIECNREECKAILQRNLEIVALGGVLEDTNTKFMHEIALKNEEIMAKDEMIGNLQAGLQEKESEFEYSFQSGLLENANKFRELEANLLRKDEECAKMRDDSKQLFEMEAIIDAQLLEIEALKCEVFAKSRDYDGLIAELEFGSTEAASSLPLPIDPPPQQQQQQKQVRFAQDGADQADDDDEPVNRAELDLALYMLHQRDVRCEELTVELMSLLEERDTLQLRLSNAIREKEQIRSKEQPADDQPTSVDLPNTSSTPGDEHQGASLANKISELKTMGYRKDKTLLDQQDLLRIQQLSFLQQHKEEMSKLPAEAAARLVDASYTLSRDVQSPSKVLLNWLWGKSTPKEVNNI